MKDYDLYDLIRNKDEEKIKSIVVSVLKNIVNKDLTLKEIHETSYFADDIQFTVPHELGIVESFKIEDKWINKALDVIANFEGDTVIEAKEKCSQLLSELK